MIYLCITKSLLEEEQYEICSSSNNYTFTSTTIYIPNNTNDRNNVG